MPRRLSVIASMLLALSNTQTARAEFTFGEAELVPNVNDGAWDASPAISRDGLALFWASQRRGGEGSFDLWTATRNNVTDDWGSPQNLGLPVNSSAWEEQPTVFIDSDTGVTSLLFADSVWFDPNVPHRPGGLGGGDIWMSTRSLPTDEWSVPANDGLLANVNSRRADANPSISSDGLNLFFDSNRGGNYDLYVATRASTSDLFGEPVRLGPAVNTSSVEVEPSIASDGLSLFFASDRPGGQGVFSLWVATRQTIHDSWGQPLPLVGVNTSAVEATPEVSGDGSTLYFLSDRPNRQGPFNLWQVPLLTDSPLQAGDADQDLDFDQLDLVQVQIAAKYLTGSPATWGEGDWNGAPGGSPGNPPAGDGLFNQLDIIAAQQGVTYLTGPYAAVQAGGTVGDGQTSLIYNTGTGELAVDAPAGIQLTSINIDSATGIFTGDAAHSLGGSFDNDSDNNVFKATFGGSFGSISFGNVAQAGLLQEFVLGDLSVVGSLAGGGDLGNVDLVYLPEPTSALLLAIGLVIGFTCVRRAKQ